MAESSFRVRLFGAFALTDRAGQPIKLPTAKAGQIVARLLLSRTGKVDRAALAEDLWPGADPGSQKTSLRTALSQLRRALDGTSAFDSDRESVWMEPSALESDLGRAMQLRRTIQLLTNSEEQEAPLQEFVDITSEPLLARWSDDWVEGARTEWTDRWLRAIRALQVVAERRGDWDAVLEYSERVLSRLPHDETSLARAMRAEVALGNSSHAIERYRRAEETIKRHIGRGPSEALRAVAESVIAGTADPAPVASPATPATASSVLGAALEGWLKSNPDAALAALNEMLYSPAGNRIPQESHAVMERAMSLTQGTSEPRMRAAAVTAWFAMQAEQLKECSHWNEFILAHRHLDHPQVVNAHNRLGVVAYYRGQLDEARANHQKTHDLAVKQGNKFMTLMSTVNLRNLDLLDGQGDGVVEELETILENMPDAEAEYPALLAGPIRNFQAVGALLRADWENAILFAQRARHIAEANGISNFGAESLGWEGIARFQLGKHEAGIQLVLDAVRQAVQFSYISASERLIRFAAGIVAASGKPQEGANLLEAVNSFCLGRGVSAFPADRIVLDHVYAGPWPRPTWTSGTRTELHVAAIRSLADLVQH